MSESAIFEAVNESAAKMGSCDPLWLRNKSTPDFSTIEEGSAGPEVLLMHGLFGALSNWDALIPLLAGYAKPIALSFPIVTAHRSEVRVKSLAAFSEYFIRDRGLAPVAICGNSLGGHVALRLCLARPDLVDCLILSGTSGLYEHTVDALPVRPDQRFIRDHMARVFYDHKFITDEAVEDIYQTIKARVNVLNLIHAARSAKKDNLHDLLPEIKVPTLLLWGENDEVTTMPIAETFHRLIPNSELVTVAGCGHAPMIEKPQWFSDQMERFLRKHSRHFQA